MTKGVLLDMKKALAICLSTAVLLTGCGANTQNTDTTKETDLTVVTSFYPVYTLALNVTDGVEGVAVKNMAQPQTGCLHDYELTTADMKTLETADVLLVNGLGMESFLDDTIAQYPQVYIGDTSMGTDILVSTEHDHDDDDFEEQPDIEENPHIWLNPANAVKQAEAIRDTLMQADPNHAAQYQENTQKFVESMKQVLQDAVDLTAADGTKVATFHEGFAYLADVAAMQVGVSIDVDENEEPSAKELAEAAEIIRKENIKLFLVADDTGRKYAEMLAKETAGNGESKIVQLDPLTSGAMDKDAYRIGMEKNLSILTEALSEM